MHPTSRPKRSAVRRRAETAPQRSRRAQEPNQRRKSILDAALDEFAARGFAAARLDDVARRAQVAKGTIYLYFRDKESLLQELVRSMLSPLIAAIESAATQRPSISLRHSRSTNALLPWRPDRRHPGSHADEPGCPDMGLEPQ